MKSAALLKLTAATVLCVVLLVSCKIMSRSLTDEGYAPVNWENLDLKNKDYRIFVAPSIWNIYQYTGETFGNDSRIEYLKYKLKNNPSKKEKYERLLQKEYAKKELEKITIIDGKMVFLKYFYADLYQLSNNDFTAKYKKNCWEHVLNELSSFYKKTHSENGFLWAAFGDNEMHNAQDISIKYLDWKDFKESTNSVFGKENNNYLTKWFEYNWFKISLGDNFVLVKVDRYLNNYRITRLLNPKLKIAI